MCNSPARLAAGASPWPCTMCPHGRTRCVPMAMHGATGHGADGPTRPSSGPPARGPHAGPRQPQGPSQEWLCWGWPGTGTAWDRDGPRQGWPAIGAARDRDSPGAACGGSSLSQCQPAGCSPCRGQLHYGWPTPGAAGAGSSGCREQPGPGRARRVSPTPGPAPALALSGTSAAPRLGPLPHRTQRAAGTSHVWLKCDGLRTFFCMT